MLVKPTILLDLDGTLLDSAPDITLALNKSLIKNKLKPVDESIVRNLIGNGSARLISDILNKKRQKDDHNLRGQIHKDFLKAYKNMSYFFSKLYPDVRKTLTRLYRSYFLVCLTNKPTEITRFVLTFTGIGSFFKLVVSGDTLSEMKPSPAGVKFCMENLKCRKENMIIVGDSLVDLKTAAAADIKAIAVTYGYNQDVNLGAEGASATAESFKELPLLIETLLAEQKNTLKNN